jgi:hypothetical protein
MNSEADFQKVARIASSAVREAQGSARIDDQAAAAAYVFVTNHTHLVDDDASATGLMFSMHGFNMPEFSEGEAVELETALHRHDLRRDMWCIFECARTTQRVPSFFENTADALVGTEGDGPPPRIGEQVRIAAPDGAVVEGVLEDVSAHGDKAAIVVRTLTGERIISELLLTPRQVQAVERYGNTIFGKPNQSMRLKPDDLVGLYEWHKGVFAKTDRAQLLMQLANHPSLEAYQSLSIGGLRTRVCREITKSVFSRTLAADVVPSG